MFLELLNSIFKVNLPKDWVGSNVKEIRLTGKNK